eukprot:scaffold112177_cov55-Attheya_sp.AAC.1
MSAEDGASRRRTSRRSSAARVDYKVLAGEVDAQSEDDDYLIVAPLDQRQKGDVPPRKNRRYANRHIPNILKIAPPTPGSIQVVELGSSLTAEALSDPNDTLTLSRPIIVHDTPESIGMTIPRSKKGGPPSIRDLADIIGRDYPVTVMEVKNQQELDGWTFGDLVDYFEDKDRLQYVADEKALLGREEVKQHASSQQQPKSQSGSSTETSNKTPTSLKLHMRRPRREPPKVLNQISLEFSHTALRSYTNSPQFVRDVDWIDLYWPTKLKEQGDYPTVQYYCLTSTAGCYTDFHVDFAGTAVWYHVLSGRKTFVLIPPTDTNLHLYEAWLCRPDQEDLFFPNFINTTTAVPVQGGIRVDLFQGQTLIIPTAWIHAVYTPEDSLVIGGNFLHGQDMELQLRVYCLETRTRVPTKFRFPHFVRMMFYVGEGYLRKMKRGDISKQEWMGMRELVAALDQWWKSQPKDGIKKGGDSKSITSAAQDAAFIGGCSSVEQMLKYIYEEIERLGRLRFAQKAPPKGNGVPKIRLSLKQPGNLSPIQSEVSLVSAPSTVETSNLPKPKLKLKLGNLSTLLKAADRDDDKAKSVEEKDDFEDLAFNIVVRPSPKTTMQSSLMAKRKKDSDLNPYRGGVQDNDDEEWVPEGSSSSRKRSLVPAVTQVVSSLMPVTSSLEHQNNLTTMGKTLNYTASKRTVASSRPPATTASAKTKPKASARDRLKKRMRF